MTDTFPGGVHRFADVFPLLSGEPYEALCADVKEHGLREPITLTHDGLLVDGRNRWAACRDASVEPGFERLPEGTTDVEILDLIVSKNIHRRHLDTTDRALLGIEYKKRYQVCDTGRPPGKKTSHDVVSRPVRSADKAAALVGVSAPATAMSSAGSARWSTASATTSTSSGSPSS